MQEKSAPTKAYKKPGKKNRPQTAAGAKSNHDERTKRQLDRHRDLMWQYNQLAHSLVGRAAFEVLPGPGSEFDPDMFRPVHKELPKFHGRPTFIVLRVVRHDRLIISEVESLPNGNRLEYTVKRWYDFGLPPIRGAQGEALDGPANHVLLTAGNNLLQELINTVDVEHEQLEEPALPKLVIMLDKVRIDEAKLEKLAAAIEPADLRPRYMQGRREAAEISSLGELFGDAEVLKDAEIAAGLRQRRAYENFEELLGAPEQNPARKIFMAKNPAREILKAADLPEDWAESADQALIDGLIAKMREAIPMHERASDADILDGLVDPNRNINFSVPVDRLPSSVVLKAMRAAIPPARAVLKHVTDAELLHAARHPYSPLRVHAYSRIQVVRADSLTALPSYASGSFFHVEPVPPVTTVVELAAE
jgi:hypothetical protein